VSNIRILNSIALNRTLINVITSRDPDADPAALLFYSAGIGSIFGMKKAVEKDPQIIYASDIFEGRSALHFVAESQNPAAMDALRWLLEKGIPWSASDKEGFIPEELARMCKNDELFKILRNWAVEKGEVILIDLCPARVAETVMFIRAQNTSCIIRKAWVRLTRMKANLSP
jgi:hypothetical protein